MKNFTMTEKWRLFKLSMVFMLILVTYNSYGGDKVLILAADNNGYILDVTAKLLATSLKKNHSHDNLSVDLKTKNIHPTAQKQRMAAHPCNRPFAAIHCFSCHLTRFVDSKGQIG